MHLARMGSWVYIILVIWYHSESTAAPRTLSADLLFASVLFIFSFFTLFFLVVFYSILC